MRAGAREEGCKDGGRTRALADGVEAALIRPHVRAGAHACSLVHARARRGAHQLPGQPPTTTEQSAPEKPKSHMHSELAHVPWPVQLPGQSGVAVEQSSPIKPGSHAHSPTSEQKPCPEPAEAASSVGVQAGSERNACRMVHSGEAARQCDAHASTMHARARTRALRTRQRRSSHRRWCDGAQLNGQSCATVWHALPVKPVWHEQTPAMQTPREWQLFSHAVSWIAQSTPPRPSGHEQTPLSHAATEEQLLGQSGKTGSSETSS